MRKIFALFDHCFTYTDVVALQRERLERWVVAGNVSEYLVGAPVPLDGVKLLVLQSEGAVEPGVLTSQQRVWDLHPQVAQPTGRNWKIQSQDNMSIKKRWSTYA